MSPPSQTAEYWRRRAHEARAEAQEAKDPDARQTLLRIAELCDQLAEEAERDLNPSEN
jgi:hypothetical protein